MEYQKKYNPFLVAKNAPKERPALEYLNIEYINEKNVDNGVMVAANGYYMSVIPCTIEKYDMPGKIHYSALEMINKNIGKKMYSVVFTTDEEKCYYPGIRALRYKSNDHKDFHFMNWRMLTKGDVTQVVEKNIFGVSGDYIGDCVKILGTEFLTFVQVEHKIIVTPQNNMIGPNHLFPIKPPFVIIMNLDISHLNINLPADGPLFQI